MDCPFAVIIPAYNSGRFLKKLLKEIAEVCPDLCLFVIDDGSDVKDEICKIVSASSLQNKSCFRHKMNRGKGAAIKSGLSAVFAHKNSFRAVIFLDSDGQHEPRSIPEFICAYEQGRGDFISGVRKFNPAKMPKMRIISNTITSYFLSRKLGVKLRDSQCGFRLIDMELLKKCAPELKANRYSLETELLIKSAKNGASFFHIPIKTIYGNQESNIRGIRDTIEFLIALFRY